MSCAADKIKNRIYSVLGNVLRLGCLVIVWRWVMIVFIAFEIGFYLGVLVMFLLAIVHKRVSNKKMVFDAAA